MQITIKGINDHKGFLLKSPLELNGRLFVFSGQNGSGKTRFFESIQAGGTEIEMAGSKLSSRDIHFITFDKLSPNLEGEFQEDHFNRTRKATLELFNYVKNDLSEEIHPRTAASFADQFPGSIPYDQLRQMCLEISLKTGKTTATLSREEIKLHFDRKYNFEFGIHNLTDTINRYLIRQRENEFNEFMNQRKNKNITFYSEERFYELFGPEPWTAFNAVLNAIFDGELKLSNPDEHTESDSYSAKLYKNNELLPLNSHSLSTGERTLLWLALTLFNTEFQTENRFSTQKLLLIDEPDAYLHPKMILKLHKTLEKLTSIFNMAIFFTTHSPTTIALHPNENIYIINKNRATKTEKDKTISELLDGITQISISPENRRQVFTESQYDANIYQEIFLKIAHTSGKLDPKISLNFVSSGPKMPAQLIIDKAKQILGIEQSEKLDEFIKGINGAGNCSQVVGQVISLAESGNQFIRGILDWDLKNHPKENIAILGYNFAYSIENIALDPISILLLLHTTNPNKLKIIDICGENTDWSSWIANQELLQKSIDNYIKTIFDRDNKKDVSLEYLSGICLFTDSEYLHINGHDLEILIKAKFPALKSFCKTGKDGELKYSIVTRAMINLSNGKLIPKAFEDVLADVQK